MVTLAVSGRLPLRHLLLGLIIRELLAPWTGHPYDFEIWVRLGFYMQNLGNPYRILGYVPGLSFAPYATIGSISYPPFSAFIFAVIYRLYLFLGEPSRFLYYFLLKQPMVLADVGVALVLVKMLVFSGNAGLAKRAYLAWLYFPLGIIISSIWGQLDSLALLLTLLSIYYLLQSKPLSSAIMLGLSIYLKTLPIILLPVILMQNQTVRNRSRYSTTTLSIPILGTLIPAFLLSWGYQGMYNNFAFQVVIPRTGEMSVLGSLSLIPTLPGLVRYLTGSVWVVALVAAYIYIYRKRLSLSQGLVIAILAFSISRPFLPEQWALYPLAFLLLFPERSSVEHFIGLAVASTLYLLANHMLLIRFFSPVTVAAFSWDVLINTQSAFSALRVIIIELSAVLYMTEALLVILGRQSLIHRAIASMMHPWFPHRSRVYHTPVSIG